MSDSINKIRVLLITGNDAFNELKAIEWGNLNEKYKISITQAPIPIISLISPQLLSLTLSKFDVNEFDIVLISGLIPWDLNKIKSPFSLKIKKGPRFLSNLPEIMRNFNLMNLSQIYPADDLYKLSKEENLASIIKENYQKFEKEIRPNGFRLSINHSDIIFSPDLPPVLIGEIVDAPKLSFKELCIKVKYYQKSGVNIIDFGCIANQNNSKLVYEHICKLKNKFNVPFSIDSINSEEIQVAVKAGAEMVLSVTIDNYVDLLDLPKDITLVVIPISTNDVTSISSDVKIERLLKLTTILHEHGFSKILLDPITGVPISPGFTSTIDTILKLKQKIDEKYKLKKIIDIDYPKPQLLMGFGNITELIDGDSSGINTLLSIIATELGVSGILSTEFSNKCRYNLEELSKSIKLAYYANQLHTTPINLGINAFHYKTKQNYPKYISYNEPIEKKSLENKPAIMDPKGYFKIYIDETLKQIFITHFENSVKIKEATITFAGDSAEDLYKRIIIKNLVSRLDHAAYLGKELVKAELALKLGLFYSQS